MLILQNRLLPVIFYQQLELFKTITLLGEVVITNIAVAIIIKAGNSNIHHIEILLHALWQK